MGFAIVPFAPEHLARIELQAEQAGLSEARAMLGRIGAQLAVPGLALSLIDGERVLGAAGIWPQWPGRAIAWAVLGNQIPRRNWAQAVAVARRGLNQAHAAGHRRIEISIRDGFANGHRLARILEFRPEGLMRAYSPDGSDHWLYARVR
jgi:hypothetical protein